MPFKGFDKKLLKCNNYAGIVFYRRPVCLESISINRSNLRDLRMDGSRYQFRNVANRLSPWGHSVATHKLLPTRFMSVKGIHRHIRVRNYTTQCSPFLSAKELRDGWPKRRHYFRRGICCLFGMPIGPSPFSKLFSTIMSVYSKRTGHHTIKPSWTPNASFPFRLLT